MLLLGASALAAAGDSLKNALGYRASWNIWLDYRKMDSLPILVKFWRIRDIKSLVSTRPSLANWPEPW